MNINFNPERDEPVVVNIDLTSSTYAFDLPKSLLNINATSEGIIIDFFEGTGEEVLMTQSFTYGELYYFMQERERNRRESMLRHPCSQLQLIDGGGNK